MTNDFYPFYQPNRQNQTSSENRSRNQSEIKFAKISIFGQILSVIGGIISIYAQFLSLEKFESEQPNNDERIRNLEKQIQYLTQQIENQKKNY
ncbi:hypothetical protein NST62_09800 [Ureibacillus sp. FSL K6-8385]|uniref:Uncharacterized protein n=1 Tax=Ureibacillus terrenus TaxID=118246 RepID=A0A540V0Q2_9BACL|nr:hypothetical protein [Ureibacillus terrenus]MED3661414.1 hypothetical protein [Ureibacillus terrenus]MED3763267.1 hypothetical protein [Ureibacillus terrenus]TQE90324.1 hypothetical protein FKZ59_10860 [Ureibacillus terrenus]